MVGSLARRLRRAAVVFAGLLLGGCQAEAVTSQAGDTAALYRFFMYCSIGIGAIVLGAMAWEVARYRRRTSDLPKQTHGYLPLETAWIVVPLLLVFALFGYTYVVQNKITANPTPDVTIRVTGFQWGWRFLYQRDPASLAGGYSADVYGTWEHQPTIWLPVGERVRFVLNSADVIHDFYIPEFLYHMDVIPGRTNVFTVDLTRSGYFYARCGTYCGEEHAHMWFHVNITSPSAYQTWLAGQPSAPTPVP